MAILRVLGVDPAFANFGFAVTRVCTDFMKVIEVDHLHLRHTQRAKTKTKQSTDDLRRVRELARDLREFVNICDVIVVEVPIGSQSANAMKSVGICYGLIGAIHNKPVIEVDPYAVKLATVGTRTASKDDMIQWAHARYPYANWITRKLKGKETLTNANEHLADAIAAVTAGIETQAFKQLVDTLKTSRRES